MAACGHFLFTSLVPVIFYDKYAEHGPCSKRLEGYTDEQALNSNTTALIATHTSIVIRSFEKSSHYVQMRGCAK